MRTPLLVLALVTLASNVAWAGAKPPAKPAKAPKVAIPAEKVDALYPILERGTRSADLPARGLAVFALPWVPERDTAPFVVDALKDPQWSVRRMAILALYFTKDARWKQPLADGLSDASLSPEADLFPMLAALDVKDATTLLLDALKDGKNPAQLKLTEALVPCALEFCDAARVALAKAGNALFLDRVQAALGTSPKAQRLRMLAILLESGKPEAQLKALQVLGDQPEKDLAQALKKVLGAAKDPAFKLEAAIASAMVGDPAAGKLLNPELGKADKPTRLRVLKALAEVANTADEGAMLPLLKVKPGEQVDLDYLQGVFEVYHRQGSDKPLPRVRLMLKEPDPVPRAVAVRFLARFEGPVSLKTLHDLVLDGSVLVRRAAVESIADFARIDSVEVLGTALNDVDQEVKLQAVRGLGRINDLSVVRHLTFVCGDANPNVKRAALLALARIHDPSVVPTLQMGLVDPDVMVRSTALRGMIESDPANGPMFFQSALMWLPAPFIRELADNLGKEAIPYVREAVRSDNPELRLLAESILEGAGAEGLDALKAIAVETTFPEIRERVVRFLFTRAGRDALPLTVRFLDEQGGPVGVKVAVLDGLGDQRNPEDAPMAEKAFLDTDERVRVAAALAYLKMFDARIPSLPF